MPEENEPTDPSSKDEDDICGRDKNECRPESAGKYYYDDAHGYEQFDPLTAEDESDDK
jgi:hypothetical protein